MRVCYLSNELYVIRFQDLTCYAASTKMKSALLPDTSSGKELLCMMCSGAQQHDRSFTMRGATGITLQPHQIVRLPRTRNVTSDPAHM